MKYLYEIKDTEANELLTPVAVTAVEAGMLLGSSPTTIVNAYRGNHLVKRRYMRQQIDVVIAKKDSIWHDWDLCTNWLLRICKGGRENSNNSN